MSRGRGVCISIGHFWIGINLNKDLPNSFSISMITSTMSKSSNSNPPEYNLSLFSTDWKETFHSSIVHMVLFRQLGNFCLTIIQNIVTIGIMKFLSVYTPQINTKGHDHILFNNTSTMLGTTKVIG